MKQNYVNNISENLVSMENIEDKEKRHQCDTLATYKDITNSDINTSLEEIKN